MWACCLQKNIVTGILHRLAKQQPAPPPQTNLPPHDQPKRCRSKWRASAAFFSLPFPGRGGGWVAGGVVGVLEQLPPPSCKLLQLGWGGLEGGRRALGGRPALLQPLLLSLKGTERDRR